MVISRWRTSQFVQGRCQEWFKHLVILARSHLGYGTCLVVYNLYLITMILFYHRNVRMDRKLMFWWRCAHLDFYFVWASIEYIRRQIEESFTSCIKGLIRKFTEIHILTIQSGVNKRNKNRGEHSVIKHPRDALKGKVEYVWSHTTYIWLPWYCCITEM
jgi:hypothetical protein